MDTLKLLLPDYDIQKRHAKYGMPYIETNKCYVI